MELTSPLTYNWCYLQLPYCRGQGTRGIQKGGSEERIVLVMTELRWDALRVCADDGEGNELREGVLSGDPG